MDTQDADDHPVDLIFSAISDEDLARLEQLLIGGIDPDIVGGPADHAPLIYALRDGFVEGVKLLLKHGASPSPLTDDRPAPLLDVVTKLTDADSLEIACALLAAGAGADVCGADGRTALYEAALMARADLCQLLIEHGAEVDAESDYGFTPLRAVSGAATAQATFVDTLRVLTRAGASTSRLPAPRGHRDNERLTPFQNAVASASIPSVAFFLDECDEDPLQVTESASTMFDLSPDEAIDELLRSAISRREVVAALNETVPAGTDVPHTRPNSFGPI
jgi:hypothetical protein